MLVTVYVGGVVGLQAVMRVLSGQESTLAVVGSTLTIAALFNPLRRWVQAFVDQRLYRRKYDASWRGPRWKKEARRSMWVR